MRAPPMGAPNMPSVSRPVVGPMTPPTGFARRTPAEPGCRSGRRSAVGPPTTPEDVITDEERPDPPVPPLADDAGGGSGLQGSTKPAGSYAMGMVRAL